MGSRPAPACCSTGSAPDEAPRLVTHAAAQHQGQHARGLHSGAHGGCTCCRGADPPASRWPLPPCTQPSRCMAALVRTEGLLCPVHSITAAATCSHGDTQHHPSSKGHAAGCHASHPQSFWWWWADWSNLGLLQATATSGVGGNTAASSPIEACDTSNSGSPQKAMPDALGRHVARDHSVQGSGFGVYPCHREAVCHG